MTLSLPRNLLDIETIYLEPTVQDFERGRDILARFPDAQRIEVPSHWKIPHLHGNQGSARLMPHRMARLVDIRTSPVRERIAALNDFVEAGYEVNVNFSPVIVGEGFLDEYDELFEEVGAALSPAAKGQMAAEVIFLTHNAALHEVNLQWHPRAETVLWQPDLQEGKISGMGGHNVRYKVKLKGPLVEQFCARLRAKMPYCGVRYAF